MPDESELLADATARHTADRLTQLAEEVRHFGAVAKEATVPAEVADAAARVAIGLKLIEALKS